MKKKTPQEEPSDPRKIGYARVSTEEQNLDMQITALKKAGVLDDNLYWEKISGTKSVRPMLELALKDARSGDTFLVWKLDRLGRSMLDLIKKVHDLMERGVEFQSLNDNFETQTATGKLVFHVLSALAQFERDMISQRTKSGLEEARRRGRQLGAYQKMTDDKAREAQRMRKDGLSIASIAKHFDVTPPTIYAALKRKIKAKR